MQEIIFFYGDLIFNGMYNESDDMFLMMYLLCIVSPQGCDPPGQ